jgi:KOW motif-containing protein
MIARLLEVGTKVRVLGGPFAGRLGVISELDGRGGARVTLGLLSARVLLENLRPAREAARPALQSSHRKPASQEEEGVRPSASRPKKTRSSRRTPSR